MLDTLTLWQFLVIQKPCQVSLELIRKCNNEAVINVINTAFIPLQKKTGEKEKSACLQPDIRRLLSN